MPSKKPLTSDADEIMKMLLHEFTQIDKKLDALVELNSRLLERQKEFLQYITNITSQDKFKLEPDMMTLFSIPNALRKTVIALYKLQEATADDLSRETKRLRAVESASANQLVRMGFLGKKREGRNVYFYIE
jgi:hypothetical protein